MVDSNGKKNDEREKINGKRKRGSEKKKKKARTKKQNNKRTNDFLSSLSNSRDCLAARVARDRAAGSCS